MRNKFGVRYSAAALTSLRRKTRGDSCREADHLQGVFSNVTKRGAVIEDMRAGHWEGVPLGQGH